MPPPVARPVVWSELRIAAPGHPGPQAPGLGLGLGRDRRSRFMAVQAENIMPAVQLRQDRHRIALPIMQRPAALFQGRVQVFQTLNQEPARRRFRRQHDQRHHLPAIARRGQTGGL